MIVDQTEGALCLAIEVASINADQTEGASVDADQTEAPGSKQFELFQMDVRD